MYYDEYFPFYAAYANPMLYQGERMQEKEFELIRLVADGLNNKEIAEQLFLSEGTVRNYLSNILMKLDLRDRTQVACFYYKNLL